MQVKTVPLNAVLLTCVDGGDSNVVEKAKTHRPVAFSVMTRWPGDTAMVSVVGEQVLFS